MIIVITYKYTFVVHTTHFAERNLFFRVKLAFDFVFIYFFPMRSNCVFCKIKDTVVVFLQNNKTILQKKIFNAYNSIPKEFRN